MSTGANIGICSSQDEFNQAFRKAIKKTDEDIEEVVSPMRNLYIVLYLIFIVWAIVLAMKVPKGNDRTLHLVLAMVFSPAYVIGHYIIEFTNPNLN
jgi:hypothetical protein